MQAIPTTVDEYIRGFPPEIRRILTAVRQTVRTAAPDAQERISYRMPALFQGGVVVYYAAFQRHIGLFPPVANASVRAQVARYAGPKGNLRFPLDEPIPHDLIFAVVAARLGENLAQAESLRRPG